MGLLVPSPLVCLLSVQRIKTYDWSCLRTKPHGGMSLPEPKKSSQVLHSFICRTQADIFQQTFKSTPNCRSMQPNFDPVFSLGFLGNQQKSVMCRSHHYAIVGKRHWARERGSEGGERITNKSSLSKIYEDNDNPASFTTAAMLHSSLTGTVLKLPLFPSSSRVWLEGDATRSCPLTPRPSVFHPRSRTQPS